ncbi:HAD family hydrolase [Halomarina oriensis]|uniref:HAD-IA family hydrolase n=1 Tax=Halomarina oriensis TaxID=671145 RepID=A0A6B0GHM1_9EURY|nr:HAD-IA family hydrolase [Halomarina oriensis]MWG34362.1 HAD-IA family hydrolase [Halomarina oriensis]
MSDPADPAVLFDLDGTLLQYPAYDTLVAAAFEDELGRTDDRWVTHYSERFFAAFGSFTPEPYRVAFVETCERFDLDADPTALAVTLVDRECERSSVPDGVRGTLDTLTAAGHPLAVCSNGVRRVQRAKLAAHDLLAPFETVVTSYDVGAHKPAADPFEAVRRAVDAETYVMVGDSDDDVEGARGAGMTALRVEGPFPDAESILAATE